MGPSRYEFVIIGKILVNMMDGESRSELKPWADKVKEIFYKSC